MYNLGPYSQVYIINILKCNKDHPVPNVNLLYDLSLESAALKLVFLFSFFPLLFFFLLILIEMVRESQM